MAEIYYYYQNRYDTVRKKYLYIFSSCISILTSIIFSPLTPIFKLFGSHANKVLFILCFSAGLAQMLGSRGSGQLLDHVAGRVMEGEPVTCHRRHNTCDLH